MELYKLDPDCLDNSGVKKADKADILRKAKELIDVSDDKVNQLVDSIDNVDDLEDITSTEGDELVRKRDRTLVYNFISSLFEEKGK